MTREYKKLLLFAAKAIVIILVLDFAVGKTLDFLYGKMKSGERARAHFAINDSNAELYVFGSSRALYHYDPRILQDSLHLTTYNAGRSAQTLLYELPVFRMILKRHRPKMVILDLNESELVYSQEKYDLVNSLLPYYPKDESVREMIDRIKPGYKYFSWSRTLPYNSSIFAILYRSLTSRGERKDINGYIYMTGHRNRTIENYDCHSSVIIDPKIVSALEEFVRLCRENGIKLIAVTSPRFLAVDCPRKDLARLKEDLARLHVEHLDFSRNSKYVDNLEYMYDEAHLNYEGSMEYTREVAHYIRQNLK